MMEVELVKELPEKQPKNRGTVLAPEVRRVTCPMCSMGWADVVIYEVRGAFHADVTEPRRCNFCKRNFRLQWLVQLVAVRMDGEPGPVIQGDQQHGG